MEGGGRSRRARPAAAALALVLGLLLGACAEESSYLPVVESNPYDISDAEQDAAFGSLNQALVDSTVLSAMAQPQPNPYGFTAADTLFAREQLEAAVAFRSRLQRARDASDYSILDSCMTTAEVYFAGRFYWEEEARKLNEEVLGFWLNQRETADSTGLVEWIAFASAMVELEGIHLAMVGAILTDIEYDMYYSWQDAPDILDRKIARQDLEISYYTGVIRCLMQGTLLRAPRFDQLGDFIAPSSVIRQRLRDWRGERIVIRDSTLTFWGTELALANASRNEPWIQYVNHMIAGAYERDVLAAASVQDLTADSLLVQAGGRESAVSLLRRKMALNAHQRSYCRRLVALIAEGRALTLLRRPAG